MTAKSFKVARNVNDSLACTDDDGREGKGSKEIKGLKEFFSLQTSMTPLPVS